MLSKDTPGTRHAGGWIVLGSSLLVVSFIGGGAGWRPNKTNSTAPVDSNSTSDQAMTASAGSKGSVGTGGPTATQGASGAVSSFPRFQVDVNHADVAELSAVPGVGPKLAQRIVDHRSKYGRFESLKDLEKVPGVGPRMASTLGEALLPVVAGDQSLGARGSAQ